jgi:hypothetical protein
VAIDAGNTPAPPNPASAMSTDMSVPATPAVMALPANANGSLASDASSTRKFYTLTVSLREIYDDNVTTVNVNPQASFETELSPSILVDFPTADSDFSGRYTLNATYYSNNGNNGSGNNSSSIDITHELIAQYMHSFSDRFNLNLAEQFRYYTEPSLFESTGTVYRSGAYVSNTLDGTFSAQWTPLFGTTTTYANTIIRYDNSDVAFDQNNIENAGSQTFSFAVFPKVSVTFGGNGDDVTYEGVSRGYTNYTGFVGLQWQALPSLSASAQGGVSYTEVVEGQPLISPYAALSVNWTLGARSALSFNYTHDVAPTDQFNASGEIVDRFSANFNYNITSNLSSHLQGIFTLINIPQGLVTSNAINAYTEDDYALDTGFTYHYNSYLDFDLGVTLSGVSSELDYLDYARDQIYVGVRGTY